MSYNYYDNDFIKFLEDLIKNDFKILEVKPYFDLINEKLPFIGSRINFEVLKSNAYLKLEKETIIEQCINFISNAIKGNDIGLYQNIIYLGDNLTEKAYQFSLDKLEKIIPFILELPQHHYIIPENAEWCLNISFEDEIQFGIR